MLQLGSGLQPLFILVFIFFSNLQCTFWLFSLTYTCYWVSTFWYAEPALQKETVVDGDRQEDDADDDNDGENFVGDFPFSQPGGILLQFFILSCCNYVHYLCCNWVGACILYFFFRFFFLLLQTYIVILFFFP
jgi:hypothetical protein